jgi:hypothetical protein
LPNHQLHITNATLSGQLVDYPNAFQIAPNKKEFTICPIDKTHSFFAQTSAPKKKTTNLKSI